MQLELLPCLVAQVSPLMVTYTSGETVAGVTLAGSTYSVGTQALAIVRSPGMPLILPIGA